jgi:ABC-type transport system involved in cytochrome c biogenesis permease component
MTAFLQLWRRELGSAFRTAIVYAAGAAFLLVMGLSLWLQVSRLAQGAADGSLAGILFAPPWYWLAMLIVTPLLTMRLFAEEYRTGTLEMLLTAPVTEAEVVLAKYAGVWTTFLLLWLPTLSYLLLLRYCGAELPPVDWGPVAAGYLGTLLIGSLFLAAGLLCSLLTRHQAIAAMACLAALGILLLGSQLPDFSHLPALRQSGRPLLRPPPHGGFRRWTHRYPHRRLVPEHHRPAAVPFHPHPGGAAPALNNHEAAPPHSLWPPACGAPPCTPTSPFSSSWRSPSWAWSTISPSATTRASTGAASSSANSPARAAACSTQVAEDIRILAVLRPTHEAYRPARALLREYAAAASGVSLEFVDPDRDLGRTEQLVRQYRLAGAECIVFDIGGRHRTVEAADLLEFGYPETDSARPRLSFRGEKLFTTAIHALTQATRPAVHFVQGHGERSPGDFDRRTGYSRIAALLRDDNLDVEILNLGESRTVPAHCALMVIAGPVREFAPFEIALIRDYLDRKGRLLLLLESRVRTGLEPLLQDWGLELGDDIVVDETRTLTGRELYITTYPDHAITAPLQNLATVLFLPRSLRARPLSAGGDKPSMAELATSSAQGWAEFDPDEASPHFDPHVDIPGPVPVAVAIERGPVPGVHVQIRPTRLVVIGDATFASNGGLMGANADLFLNAVNWLLDREDLLALAPKTFEELRLVMDAAQLRRLFALAVLGLPGAMALLGLGILWHRRR